MHLLAVGNITVYSERIHPSLTADYCSDDGYVGYEPVAKKESCAKYW